MAPRIFKFLQKIFKTSWKAQVEYGQSLSRRHKSNCVLKSVSSKSSLSDGGSSFTDEPLRACSMNSINFAFQNVAKNQPADPCCAKKCCKKCFCVEGEAIAKNLRRSRMERASKKCVKCEPPKVKEICSSKKCFCSATSVIEKCCQKCCCPLGALGSSKSLDSACDLTSASSCDDVNCQFRPGSVGVSEFIHIHAAAFSERDYETLTPKYENVPPADLSYGSVQTAVVEPPYDSVPPRTPRAVHEPKYENVLSVHCVDACVFREISALVDSTKTAAEMMESLQEIHKNYSCVRRPSSADNAIDYYYANLEEFENDLNSDIERHLSD